MGSKTKVRFGELSWITSCHQNSLSNRWVCLDQCIEYRDGQCTAGKESIQHWKGAWAKASDFFEEVADSPLVEVNQKTYRLFDLPEVRKSNAADADRIELEYGRTECMHGFSICEVAATPLFRDAMTTIHDAKKPETSASRCLEMYESAFQRLGEAFRKQEEQLAVARLLAPEWQDYEFRRMKMGLPENDSTKAFREMQQLKQSYSEYRISRMRTLLKNHEQGEQ